MTDMFISELEKKLQLRRASGRFKINVWHHET